jgi:uncharacterized repeat protein (TIGR03987 family)
MLQIGMNLIFIACVFYTIGVWSEKIQKRLKLWHLTMFYLGLVCDTIGTGAMAKLSGGLLQFNFHGLRYSSHTFNAFSFGVGHNGLVSTKRNENT